MPANGRYNRQALNRSRPLLAPIQVAAQTSTITPTRYISRRSSETASDAPNTAPAASTPTPSEPNLKFHLRRSAGVSFIIALWIRMRVRARLDSKFSRSESHAGHATPQPNQSEIDSGDRLCQPGTTKCERRKAEPKQSEEHTSELQSHSGISYAVFCL